MWGLTRYEWLVLFAAWVGWGFDVFDALLFNFVAPNCVPTLLGIPLGSEEARAATGLWTGRLTSLLLVGWAAGGIFFGWMADRVGRTRTLLFTILLYSVGTALCAVAPNIWALTFFRLLSSLGIGGEWAAGAAMVAEVVPAHKRLEAGALLYTAAPVGLVAAALVNQEIAGELLKDSPETSWRWVFVFGLLPALAALVMRFVLKEPEEWAKSKGNPSIRELFSPEYIRLTRSGLITAVVALLSWWSISAFMPFIADGLAKTWAVSQRLDTVTTSEVREAWKTYATLYFCAGGLLGTLLTVPIARHWGRKQMFALYFAGSLAAILTTFGVEWPPEVRLRFFFFIGLTIFGVFGSFTYYLPELFPTRLRATGSGFCYNVGRIITAFGPLLVAHVSRQGHEAAFAMMLKVAAVPLLGLLLLPLVVETKEGGSAVAS